MADFKHASQQGTVFNMGLATLERINQLLNLASEYAIEENYYKWYNVLFTLKRDVIPFLNDTKDVEESFKNFPQGCWTSIKGVKTIDSDVEEDIPKLLDELDSKLRLAMKKAGLLMPKKSDPRYSWAMEA